MLDIFRFHPLGISESTLQEILKTNELSQKYGLVLAPAEARGLVESRNRAIKNHGRVELGMEVVKKVIAVFCTSPYINQADYVEIVEEMIEIFYIMKNETEDRIGDDELITIMYEYFNTSCCGSVELLKSREMALFARQFRSDLQIANNVGEGW